MTFKTMSINDIADAHVNYIKEKYPKRYEKALKFKFHEDFLRCIGGYVLLTEMIGDFEEENVTYSPEGKPSIEGKPCYNISHSGDYILVGISDEEIGVDIELIKEKNLNLGPKVFNQDELNWMNQEDSTTRFHYLWCQKESVMKLTGKGIKIPFFSIDVLPFEENKPINFDGYEIENKTAIFDDNYIISISQKIRK